MLQGIKFKIKNITEKQKEYIIQNSNQAAIMWNKLLEISNRRETIILGGMFQASSQIYYPFKLKDLNYGSFKQEWMEPLNSRALVFATKNLKQSFKMFFEGKRGYPKFKRLHDNKKSFTTDNIIKFDGKCITPPKPKLYDDQPFQLKISKILPKDFDLKFVTFSKVNNDYYCSLNFDDGKSEPDSTIPENAIGLDWSPSKLYVDNNSKEGYNIQKDWLNSTVHKIVKFNQILSKKIGSKKFKKKSNNYIKVNTKLTKKYNKITNKRTDNLHKQSTDLIAQYDLVCVEDLDLKELIVNDNNKKFNFKRLRKSIQNSSAGKFFNFLAYKAKKNGKHFIKVERKFPSSQCCSICGRKVLKTKDLNNRNPKCPICDTQHDRDINAAINILNRGLQLFKSPLGNGLKALREGTPQYEF